MAPSLGGLLASVVFWHFVDVQSKSWAVAIGSLFALPSRPACREGHLKMDPIQEPQMNRMVSIAQEPQPPPPPTYD